MTINQAGLSPKKSSPILLTGAHRSGTTWLANMLSLSNEVQMASEPFNLDSWAYKLNDLAKYWFTYAPALNQVDAISAFNKVLECKTRKVYGRRTIQRYAPFSRNGRLLIKDPIACLSSEWIARNFDINVIILVRHPAAFAASLRRMNWRFDFSHLSNQGALMEELLIDFKAEIENPPEDIIDQASLLWRIIYSVLSGYKSKNPDWLFVRHEDLSAEPEAKIKELYDHLQLDWNDHVLKKLREYTSSNNPINPKQGIAHQMKRDSSKNIKRWKTLLSNEEIARLKDVTAPISSQYYSESDW